MNDDFLSEMRRDPDPEFANRLRARLRREEQAEVMPGLRWRPALAIAATLAVIAGLFAFPSVRASAQAVLDIFRVRNFTAIQFDPTRLEKLHVDGDQEGGPLKMMGKMEIVTDPGKPQEITRETALSMSSLQVKFPSELPSRLTLKRVMIEGAGEARLTPDVAKVRSVLETLDIRDITVPASIDGRAITVRKPPIVVQEYANDRSQAAVVQARSPEVELPAGIDLPQLAEVGLRILGVEPAEARRLARSVDWRSTMLIPVPANVSSFRNVEIHGQSGLMITTPAGTRPDGKPRRGGSMVMWSEGDQVYAVTGDVGEMDLMQIAESIR